MNKFSAGTLRRADKSPSSNPSAGRPDGTSASASQPTPGTAVGVAKRSVAAYPNYQEAQEAVDRLADRRFPVERVSIVGRDPRMVERATGRLGAGVVAGRAALSGAILGALFGWLLGLFDLVNPLVGGGWLALNGALLGGVLGALLGLLAHALTRGRRRFTPLGGFEADSYEVRVDADIADEAARALQPRTSPVEPPGR